MNVQMMESQPERLFLIWAASRGHYTLLRQHLVEENWTVLIIEDLHNLSQLEVKEENLTCLAILRPSGSLNEDEIKTVRDFLSLGHLAIFASSAADDDDERNSPSDILNKITSTYGVRFKNDCVIRPNLYKLYHPQQAMIEDFVANRGLGDALKNQIERRPSEDSLKKISGGPITFGPRLIYPNGCTMSVDTKLSTIVLTSSKWAIPSCQPVGALHRVDAGDSRQVRIVFLGSADLMTDQYLAKEDNLSLVDCMLNFLTDRRFPVNISDARTIEIMDYNLTPDIERLAEKPIGCLSELDPLPEDKTELIEAKLFSLDNSQLPKVIQAYKEFGIPYKPLTLISPKFRWNRTETEFKFLLKRPD